jgi:hypothetical protein
MGFIYYLLYNYNIILQKRQDIQKKKDLQKKRAATPSKRTPLIIATLVSFFRNTLFFQEARVNYTSAFLSTRVNFLNFVLRNLSNFFFISLTEAAKTNKVLPNGFRTLKSNYKVFLTSKGTKTLFKNYYYIFFFKQFYFNSLTFFYFKVLKALNLEVINMELYFCTKFFLTTFKNNNKTIKFYNLSNNPTYLSFFNSFNSKTDSIIGTNHVADSTTANFITTKKINLEVPKRVVTTGMDTSIDLDNVLFTSQLVSLDNKNLNNYSNINFVKINKLYNKGRFSRNKQTYRTGVIWCLWLTILSICGPFYYFYSFSFNFTYLWFLFILLVLRFSFVYLSKYNYINSWKIVDFIKSFLLNNTK